MHADAPRLEASRGSRARGEREDLLLGNASIWPIIVEVIKKWFIMPNPH